MISDETERVGDNTGGSDAVLAGLDCLEERDEEVAMEESGNK